MDIVVCGAQKPFMSGGAELHQENLVTQLKAAGHNADLVRLPVAWEKDRLFDSALAWRTTPIDADLVIATNFPSYYVRHPNKVVWLFHQHRGAYDGADAQANWSDFGFDDISFETQRLIAEWDAIALDEAKRVFTTSEVVAERLLRYNGISATALYHPPPLADQLTPGEFGDYVVMATRMEQNKRPELLAEALAKTASGVRAVGLGRGEMLEEVRELGNARGVSDRLSLPGFVSDEELLASISGALAVLYAPSDEDYGYASLQGFYAGKPVITASDSGGVLEFVEHEVTGLVTDGSPEGVAEAMDRLFADHDLARRLGDAGRERVQSLSWQKAVEMLTA